MGEWVLKVRHSPSQYYEWFVWGVFCPKSVTFLPPNAPPKSVTVRHNIMNGFLFYPSDSSPSQSVTSPSPVIPLSVLLSLTYFGKA